MEKSGGNKDFHVGISMGISMGDWKNLFEIFQIFWGELWKFEDFFLGANRDFIEYFCRR